MREAGGHPTNVRVVVEVEEDVLRSWPQSRRVDEGGCISLSSISPTTSSG